MFNINKLRKLKPIVNKHTRILNNQCANNNNNNCIYKNNNNNDHHRTYSSSTNTSAKLDEEVATIKRQQQIYDTNTPIIEPSPIVPKPKSCWCVLSCKLVGKRILSSQIKPIKYEDERALMLLSQQQQQQPKQSQPSQYLLHLDLPLSASRKQLIQEMIKAKDQYIIEQKIEEEQEAKLQKEKQDKENKQLFQTDGEENREFPVLTDDDTSIGPIHILYKNQWISTIVERIETSHKDNEPQFILKIKTPIKLSSKFTFSVESIHSTLDRLLSTGKIKVDGCEFDKMFLTTVENDKDKEFTNWIKSDCNNSSSEQISTTEKENFKKSLLLKEALLRLKTEILPNIGFDNCSIDLVLSKDSIVGCKEGRQQLEFPDSTYQLVLEIDSNEESIWGKSPESVEKILYLYTMMLDSLVSMGHTDNVPLSVSYL